MGIALGETMDRVTALEKSQQSISKECKKMQDKCQDLENRSRRQNLRLVGITEGAEGGNMIKFLADFFPAVLGADNFSSLVVIDRAHRTLAPRLTSGERPRAILVRLHYYTDKQKILDLGKTKGRLTYKGDQVHIFPDMSPEVSRQRAAFNPVKRKLREANVTYSLFYPARLAINVDGIRHSFDSPKAAEDFYDQKIAKVD
uniref:L1 transposable element RRM domain-containing protein n=1 Tax=Dicentrarchus labrax TaxID=13489 RepID=A0A8P4G1W7_DICLA